MHSLNPTMMDIHSIQWANTKDAEILTFLLLIYYCCDRCPLDDDNGAEEGTALYTKKIIAR